MFQLYLSWYYDSYLSVFLLLKANLFETDEWVIPVLPFRVFAATNMLRSVVFHCSPGCLLSIFCVYFIVRSINCYFSLIYKMFGNINALFRMPMCCHALMLHSFQFAAPFLQFFFLFIIEYSTFNLCRFHPSCMGMTIEQAKKLDHFLCADCVKENGTKRPSNSYPASSNSDSKVGYLTSISWLTVYRCSVWR